MRRMRVLHWMEFFLVLPTTLMVTMWTVFWLIGLLIGVAMIPVFVAYGLSQGDPIGGGLAAFGGAAFFVSGIVLVTAIGLVALILLHVAIVAGPGWFASRPILRRSTVAFGILGFVEAGWLLVWILDPLTNGSAAFVLSYDGYGIFLLAAPILVGVKYLYLLLFRTNPERA